MTFLNYLISTNNVSAVLMEGILSPIIKEGVTCDGGNYRDITVTPVVLKILEHILNTRHNVILSTQSRLQRGFTEGRSSLKSAIILNERELGSANNEKTRDRSKAVPLLCIIFLLFMSRVCHALCLFIASL